MEARTHEMTGKQKKQEGLYGRKKLDIQCKKQGTVRKREDKRDQIIL